MKTNSELPDMIKTGENEALEFKSSFNTEVIETLVAFANAGGGKVVVGINQKNEPTGVLLNPESVQNWINEIKSKTSPSLIPNVEINQFEDKTLVVFSIQEYPVKPVATRGKYFKRVANSNHLMDLSEIANEHLKTINSSWDFYPDPNHGINDISIDKVSRIMRRIEKQAQTEITFQPLDFLTKFEIVRNKQLTFGGYLLFASDYCSISDVQIGRFKSETMIIDSISLNTDLFTEVEDILAFIKKHLMVEYIITGEPQRTERFDYPINAIREIVINMVVHRDYRDSNQSIIKIFNDKIEFYNPGKLTAGISIEDLLSGNYISQTRNKLIAKTFKAVGLIERYGSGIQRILNICSDYGVIPPVFEELFNGFRVTLYKKNNPYPTRVGKKVIERVVDKVNEKVVERVVERVVGKVGEMVVDKVGEKAVDKAGKLITVRVGEKVGENIAAEVGEKVVGKVVEKVVEKVVKNLSKNQQNILKYIKSDPYASAINISKSIGISHRKTQENLRKLKSMGILERVGPDKGGYWVVTKN